MGVFLLGLITGIALMIVVYVGLVLWFLGDPRKYVDEMQESMHYYEEI